MAPVSRPPRRRFLVIERSVRDGMYPNSESLAAALEVDSRTIQRDIAFLKDQLGAPLDFCRKRNRYYLTVQVPETKHAVETICRTDLTDPPSLRRLIDWKYDDGSSAAVQEIRLPRNVTEDRIFSQADTFMEMNGRAIPLKTSHAW